MTVKYLARLFYRDIVQVSVVEETEKKYKLRDRGRLLTRDKVTNNEVLFNTEIEAKCFIAMSLFRSKNEINRQLSLVQSRFLETLLRFNLEQCEKCCQFHEIGADHDCSECPF